MILAENREHLPAYSELGYQVLAGLKKKLPNPDERDKKIYDIVDLECSIAEVFLRISNITNFYGYGTKEYPEQPIIEIIDELVYNNEKFKEIIEHIENGERINENEFNDFYNKICSKFFKEIRSYFKEIRSYLKEIKNSS